MIIVFVLIAMGCVLHLTKGVFSPARLFALMWTILIIGYYCFAENAVSGIGLLWIVAAMIVLAFGEKLGVNYAINKYKSISEPCKIVVSKVPTKRLFRALLLIIMIAIAGKICFLYANGYSLSVFFNINRFLEMNAQMAYDRYHDLTVTNNFITLLSSFGYVAPLCGGYLLFYTGKSKKRIFLCIFSLFPVLLSMLMDNTKSGVIDAAILFAVGFMISYMRTRSGYPKLRFKQIAAIIFLLALLLIILFIAMCIRVGDFSQSAISDIKDSFVVYAFGSVEAFDVWLTKYYAFGSYGFGVNTFMAPFNILGIVTREQGVYGFIPGVSSNVFSAFRGVIMDFGVFGGLLFVFALGFLGGVSYRKIRSRGSVGSQFIYAVIFFFLIRSFLISPWIYTSFWVTFFVFLLFLFLASKRTYVKRIDVQQVQAA